MYLVFGVRPERSGEERTVRYLMWATMLVGSVAFVAIVAASQEAQTSQEGAQQSYQNMTAAQRAAATRAFLGLGAVPDKAAAARGASLFAKNCAFCHGQTARGATGPSLITSDMVLGRRSWRAPCAIPQERQPGKRHAGVRNHVGPATDGHCRVSAPAGGGCGESRRLPGAEHPGWECRKGKSLCGGPLHVVPHGGDVCAHCEQVPLARATAAQLDLAGARCRTSRRT